MNTSSAGSPMTTTPSPRSSRLDYLDATRAFALLLGVVFHASLSFMPFFTGWAVQDVSTGALAGTFFTVSHTFRMDTFFLLAGFLGHVIFHRKGAFEFVRSRVIRIGVPFVLGWFLLRPLVVSGWIMGAASLRGDVDVWAGLRGGFQSLANLPTGIFTGTHLWFLYYLALITALTLVIRWVVMLAVPRQWMIVRRADSLVMWLANSPVSLVILAVPTAATLWCMRFWGMDTPDQSLRPHLPVLVIYGGFFVLGWMLNRQREPITRITRLTPARWILAGLGITAILLLGQIERDPGHPHFVATHVAYAVSYALTMWLLVFLTIGVFRKRCQRPNAIVRYVADSSYWMYLIHLPIVVWLQVAVAEFPLYWSLKLTFISTMTIATSLLTYDLLVRSTFVGWVLSGRRRDRVVAPWVLRSVLHLGRGNKLRPWAKFEGDIPAP